MASSKPHSFSVDLIRKQDEEFEALFKRHNYPVVTQFASDVRSFSSQYGSDISISYTAYNICGKPSKYPAYGDFPQTFVMRTYGKWWDMAPSRRSELMPQNYPALKSQDYIDVTFEHKVVPTNLKIFETYHPGSVVRVWALIDDGTWKLLWEGRSRIMDHQPNIFTPILKQIKSYVNLLRIEFDHSNQDYYTEIDAVSLTGIKQPPQDGPVNADSNINNVNSSVLRNLCLQPVVTKEMNVSRIFLNFLHNDYPNYLQSSVSSTTVNEKPKREHNGVLSVLPDETILKIFSYLDLRSLCRCEKVNRYFHMLASDASLYTTLNFQPYWHSITSNALKSFIPRCKRLQKLDLSWCGNYGSIKWTAFCSFIRFCGQHLTVIRLDCCSFVNDRCIDVIASVCTDLQELTLHNCNDIHESGFLHLCSLRKLERLELYRTAIEVDSLSKILQSSPKLKHLNLGSCRRISSMDEIAQILGKYNKELVSVDFWKTYSLTPIGIKALSQCSKLEEIDIGWCLGVSIPGDCFISLAMGCPGLRKLFMGSLRGIMDKDLYPFLYNCPKLEQLDLLGNRNVTAELCYNILKCCKYLKFLDVSFCEQISNSEVDNYRIMFPKVDIKRSFQCDADSPSFTNHY